MPAEFAVRPHARQQRVGGERRRITSGHCCALYLFPRTFVPSSKKRNAVRTAALCGVSQEVVKHIKASAPSDGVNDCHIRNVQRRFYCHDAALLFFRAFDMLLHLLQPN